VIVGKESSHVLSGMRDPSSNSVSCCQLRPCSPEIIKRERNGGKGVANYISLPRDLCDAPLDPKALRLSAVLSASAAADSKSQNDQPVSLTAGCSREVAQVRTRQF